MSTWAHYSDLTKGGLLTHDEGFFLWGVCAVGEKPGSPRWVVRFVLGQPPKGAVFLLEVSFKTIKLEPSKKETQMKAVARKLSSLVSATGLKLRSACQLDTL